MIVPLELVGARANVSAAAAGSADPDSPVADPEDFAPDGGSYTFTKRTLRGSSVSFTPRQPRAGLLFRVRTVTIDVSGVGSAKPEYTCTGGSAQKNLRAAAACAWRIPKTACGRRLRIAVVANYEGERFVLPAKSFVVR